MNRRKEKREFIISSNPSLVAPVSEVAEEKYFCPLLIWGWLRKMGEGRRGGGTGDLREVY